MKALPNSDVINGLGERSWVIPEGHIPSESTGPMGEMTSHETACLVNTGYDPASVEITIFFSDRDPGGSISHSGAWAPDGSCPVRWARGPDSGAPGHRVRRGDPLGSAHRRTPHQTRRPTGGQQTHQHRRHSRLNSMRRVAKPRHKAGSPKTLRGIGWTRKRDKAGEQGQWRRMSVTS
jgi:hypothetical protein